jgi:hypothetical protein
MNRSQLLDLHDSTCRNARSIMERKNSDYTGGINAADNPFANFKMAAVIGVHPVTGLLLRMMDKIQRVRTFTNDSALAVADESVEDAFDDIVNYAILGKGLLLEMRGELHAAAPIADPSGEMGAQLAVNEYQIRNLSGALTDAMHRMETIRETHPSISLDSDIENCRKWLPTPGSPSCKDPGPRRKVGGWVRT